MSAGVESLTNSEYAAAFRDMMMGALADELETTKKVLLAIPEDKKNWKPDAKARSAWELAVHIAQTGIWFLDGIADLNFDQPEKTVSAKNIPELVNYYDTNYKRSLQRVKSLSPKQLAKPVRFFSWNYLNYFYIRFELVHVVHHRGQLCTYLRPMGSKVPSIYGGSADEPFQPAE